MASSHSTACLLLLCLCAFVSAIPDSNISRSLQFQSVLRQFYPQITEGSFGVWRILQLLAMCSIFPGCWYLFKRQRNEVKSLSTSYQEVAEIEGTGYPTDQNDAEVSDPGLLKKHSEIKSYTTSRFTYTKVRVFYRQHPQADKLPTEPPLPLLVFVHGLGGSVAQFHPLLTSLVNLAGCLAIDLPGCGMSTMEPKNWDAYTTDALAELLGIIIEDYRETESKQSVVLIGHSMGCSLAAMIASRNSPISTDLAEYVVGLIAVCPKSEPPTEEQVKTFRKLLWIPGPVFNAWRRWDRRGGTESASVYRFVGADADSETKKLQYRFNEQSKTEVWRRMASGSLPTYENHVANGGLPGANIWAGLDIPVFLVAGEADHVTKPEEIEKISKFLGKPHPVHIEVGEDSKLLTDAAAPVGTSTDTHEKPQRRLETLRDEDFSESTLVDTNHLADASHSTHASDPAQANSLADPDTIEDVYEDPSTPNDGLSIVPHQPARPRKVLKTTILPDPASHALLYQPATVRILAGLISDFLSTQVSPRLSLGWQLQFLSTSGKWDVKNLEKWQKVKPVSNPIAGVFRAMKTLREVDETHCPGVFVREWGGQIRDVVDISHESPVYDPRGLENGGIHYHKFPTVSKIPPTSDEVISFIALIDRLRDEQKARAETEGGDGVGGAVEKWYIGVHCHYGFNRTGYFIVCYLVERMGYDVQDAIDEFARQRPKGVKHAHFLDQLFLRFCKGLKRAPTI